MSLTPLQLDCIRDYRRYADTVAILSAVHDLLQKHPEMGQFIGIERKLKRSKGYVTPDLVALYDTKGLIFELKWSLPLTTSLLEEEVKELKKYTDQFSNWKTPSGQVDHQDIVLVCHIDDVKRVVDAVQRLAKQPEYSFLSSDGFAIWAWFIAAPKHGERKEELRLSSEYGGTRNDSIENMIQEPGGILISENVLTYLRFNFFFIRQKPPVQYTMSMLIQHVFLPFQLGIEREFYEVDTDLICELAARVFFPSWHEYDANTVQLKRRWIRESLDSFEELKLIKRLDRPDWWKVPSPVLRSRQQTQIAVCRRIANWFLKQIEKKRKTRAIGVKPIRVKPIRGPKKVKGPLNDFLSKGK